MKIETVTAAELGRILGIGRGAISNLATDGVLPRADRGQYDVAACVQAFVRHRVTMAKAGDPNTVSLTAERSRLARIKADQAEREAAVQAGEYIRAADIQRRWIAIATTVRSRLLLIPTKLATRLAGKSPAEVQGMLRSEINAALTDISTTGITPAA